MIINDVVYGKIRIVEPVLIELIQSKPVQRLKKISQSGATRYAIKKRNTTRYQHSLGVMVLLRKFNATVEEQIAGLLHDIPHTAFSHVIDFIFKNEKQDFHEKYHEKILFESEIPKILKKYGYDVNRIIDENNFQLLEKKIPNLCADRIDYVLRDMLQKEGCRKKINYFLDNLVVVNNEIIFKNKVSAKKFGEFFLTADKTLYSNPREIAYYNILAEAVKKALEIKIITLNDLFKDDYFVLKKMKNSNNRYILEKLKLLNPRLKIKLDNKKYDYFSRTKLRFVDPKSLDDMKRVSQTFPSYKLKLKKHAKSIAKGLYIRIN